MSEIKVKFNVKTGLGDFDPTKSLPMQTSRNGLKVGESYVFLVHPGAGSPKGEAKWGQETLPLVMTDDNIECNAPYVAGIVISNGKEIMNADHEDKKFRCILPARLADTIGTDTVIKHTVEEDNTFPKIKIVARERLAMNVKELNANLQDPDKISAYTEEYGMSVAEMEKAGIEWIGHCGRNSQNAKYNPGKVNHLYGCSAVVEK